MKLKHILILFFAALFSSCHGDPNIVVFYTYGNLTDKTITINSYMPEKSEDDQIINYVQNGQLIIEPGKEASLITDTFLRRGQPLSFDNLDPFPGCYITVSNGEKTFTQRWGNWSEIENTLYDEDIYTTKKIKRDTYSMKYVFTDKDFIDAEPVE